jgi:excisionase family DNA binding protein
MAERRQYTTQQVCRLAEINRATLQRWIADGEIKAPKPIEIGGVKARMWGAADLALVEDHRKKAYRKRRRREAGWQIN